LILIDKPKEEEEWKIIFHKIRKPFIIICGRVNRILRRRKNNGTLDSHDTRS
jgi:hypothetical protein